MSTKEREISSIKRTRVRSKGGMSSSGTKFVEYMSDASDEGEVCHDCERSEHEGTCPFSVLTLRADARRASEERIFCADCLLQATILAFLCARLAALLIGV